MVLNEGEIVTKMDLEDPKTVSLISSSERGALWKLISSKLLYLGALYGILHHWCLANLETKGTTLSSTVDAHPFTLVGKTFNEEATLQAHRFSGLKKKQLSFPCLTSWLSSSSPPRPSVVCTVFLKDQKSHK
jgi:hypothetical protein